MELTQALSAGFKPLGHLEVEHYRRIRGKYRTIEYRDLGWGFVSTSAMVMLALDYFWMGRGTPGATLGLMNYHMTGTGSTAAGAGGTDYQLGTMIAAAGYTGSTNGYFTGTVTAPTQTTPNIYNTSGTLTYNNTYAVTEWGLSMANGAALTGNTGTGATATTFTDTTNHPFGASASAGTFGNCGQYGGWTLENNTTAINTPTTTNMALITGWTSTSVIQIATGWVTLALGVPATNPPTSYGYCIYPTMLDRKQFAALNVIATDVLTFNYSLTCNAGG